MKKIFYSILIIAFLATLIGCKSSPKLNTSTTKLYSFTDAKGSVDAMLREDAEGFFSKIQAIDVAIQMKDNSLTKDPAYLAKYRTFLKTQGADFTAKEKIFMDSVITDAIDMIKAVNPKILTNFKVCKIKTGHYGADVYYTRGDAIFVPENIFENPKKEMQIPVMLHEIWHILSEANPKIKDEMYKLIGFEKHNLKINYPSKLKKFLLTNPDGALDEYAVRLAGNKLALPIILSQKENFDAANPTFFNYLRFELYGIDNSGKIEMNENDLSTSLTAEQQASFFKQIKDNTQYIIHADEVIADNFMLAVLANKSKDYSKFNVEGKKLIESVVKVIQAN